MQTAALLCAVGLDGVATLHNADPIERIVLEVIAQRLIELRAQEREDLAVRIINRLSEALK